MAGVLRILKKAKLHVNVKKTFPVLSKSRLVVTDHTSDPDTNFIRQSLPVITSRQLPYANKYLPARQAWLENMDTIEVTKLGMLDLHPDIFATFPRLDILFHNLRWQRLYCKVDFKSERTRAEMPGGGRKPWRQKGTGRARHGSIRSPIWIRGGKAHGARGPKTFFYMLSFPIRVRGLVSALTCKFAQNDLRIVDSLEIPTADSKYIEDLVEQRGWGVSVLFVNDTDVMPKNITLAIDKISHFTLMPYYGLNVYSMLKYDTIVMTLDSLNKIEERLVFHLNRADINDVNAKYHHQNFIRTVIKNSSLDS